MKVSHIVFFLFKKDTKIIYFYYLQKNKTKKFNKKTKISKNWYKNNLDYFIIV